MMLKNIFITVLVISNIIYVRCAEKPNINSSSLDKLQLNVEESVFDDFLIEKIQKVLSSLPQSSIPAEFKKEPKEK